MQVSHACFDARPHPDLLPQEKEQRLDLLRLMNDYGADPVADIYCFAYVLSRLSLISTALHD